MMCPIRSMFARVGSVIVVAAVSFVAGCAGTPPTNFYTLSSVVPGTQAGSAQTPAVVVAIGPVSLPDYIDRPQIVTRESAYAVKVASYDQWAGPLSDMVPRVLIDNVAAALPQDRVVGFPRVSGTSFDYRIAIDITRFDADPSGAATLVAHWQIYDRVARRALLVTDDTFVRQAANTSYEAIVAAMSGTLADLSGRLADDVAATTTAARPAADARPPTR